MSADLIGIVDAIDLPIVVVSRDFVVASFNRPAASALSLTAANIGQSPRAIDVFSDFPDVEKLCAQVTADGVPSRREVKHRGSWFLLRIAPYAGSDDRVGGTVLTFTNVTAFRASVEKAIHEREFTKAILNTVIEPLVVLDADLRIQTANRAFHVMFQVSRDGVYGVPLDRLPNHTWKSGQLWGLLKATVYDNKEFETLEVEHDFPGVGSRTLLVDARQLPQEASVGKLLLIAFQDITERRKIEQDLREAHQVKDEFLATLAHELRGPLAPLRNMLEVMKRVEGRDDLIQQASSTMDRQLFQMTRVVDDLLDVSRISRGRIELKPERVELASVVYQAIETCRPLSERAKHEVIVTLPREPVHVLADPVRLAQVFGNLLNNACKYTESGGRIELSGQVESGDNQSPEIVVKVKDSGVGIPTEMLDSIFAMFQPG